MDGAISSGTLPGNFNALLLFRKHWIPRDRKFVQYRVPIGVSVFRIEGIKGVAHSKEERVVGGVSETLAECLQGTRKQVRARHKNTHKRNTVCTNASRSCVMRLRRSARKKQQQEWCVDDLTKIGLSIFKVSS